MLLLFFRVFFLCVFFFVVVVVFFLVFFLCVLLFVCFCCCSFFCVCVCVFFFVCVFNRSLLHLSMKSRCNFCDQFLSLKSDRLDNVWLVKIILYFKLHFYGFPFPGQPVTLNSEVRGSRR